MTLIKKTLPLLIMALIATSCSQYKVYSVKDNPLIPVDGGAVFALPKTQLRVAVTVERRDLSQAPYAAFASEFLGVDEMDSDTAIHLVSIDVDGVNVADPDYYYYVKIRKGSLTIDKRHLLLAIGMDNPADNVVANPSQGSRDAAPSASSLRAEYNLYDRTDTFYTRYDVPGHPSQISSKKDVRSTRQRAMAAAERLEEVQEKQRQLINGEYEGSYGAESVQYLYAQLRRQEEYLVSLFCGVSNRETVYFFLDPPVRRKEDYVDTVVWFSPSQGFSLNKSAHAADAHPIVCIMHCDNSLRSTGRFVKYHTSGATANSASGHTGRAANKRRGTRNFRYRVPENAEITVTSPFFTVKRDVPMSQMGPIVELPRHRVKAVFDANTLDLKELKVHN